MGTSKGNQTARLPIQPDAAEAKNSDGEAKADAQRPAGRIVHDARGNAVWNWGGGADTTRVATDSTSTMLKRLELPGLKVEGQEETVKTPAAKGVAAVSKKAAAAPPPDISSGYNPYDQRSAVRKPTEPKGPVGKKSR